MCHSLWVSGILFCHRNGLISVRVESHFYLFPLYKNKNQYQYETKEDEYCDMLYVAIQL